MKGYVARRFLLMIPTLFGLTVLIFGAMRVLPGGGLGAFVVDDMVSQQLTDVQIQAIKTELGLDIGSTFVLGNRTASRNVERHKA